jgi:hypothetical protein
MKKISATKLRQSRSNSGNDGVPWTNGGQTPDQQCQCVTGQ